MRYVCGGILDLKLSYLNISLWELPFSICACCVDTGRWLANASGTANLNSLLCAFSSQTTDGKLITTKPIVSILPIYTKI